MEAAEFKRRIDRTDLPVVVDFWAPWCAPCRTTRPILEDLAEEFAGRVDFLAVNADQAREVVQAHGIRGIPTVMSFRNGALLTRVTGARTRSEYRSLFEAAAEGQAVQISIRPFERVLRLGAGLLLVTGGMLAGSWILLGAGVLVGFTGVYDRCPAWKALTGRWLSGGTS